MKQEIDNTKIKTLKRELLHGDYSIISHRSGIKKRIVIRVFSEYDKERVLLSDKVIKVIQAAEELIQERKNLNQSNIINRYAV